MDAGASAVQLFDSWAGVLSAADYEARVLPHSREVFEAIGARDVPRIHFGVGTGELLPLIGDAGRRRRRRRLAGAAGRGGPPGRAVAARCRATSTPPSCWPTARPSTARCAGSSSRAAPPGGTSSTWATACCPTPTPGVLTHVAELVHELTGPMTAAGSSSSAPGSPAWPPRSSGTGGVRTTRSSCSRPVTGSAASCTGSSWPGTGTTPAPRRCWPGSPRPCG